MLNDENRSDWAMFKNKDRKRTEDRLLLGQNDKIQYEGKTRMQNNVSE